MHKKELLSLTKIFGKKYRKIFTYSSSKANNPWKIFGGRFSSRLPLKRLNQEILSSENEIESDVIGFNLKRHFLPHPSTAFLSKNDSEISHQGVNSTTTLNGVSFIDRKTLAFT